MNFPPLEREFYGIEKVYKEAFYLMGGLHCA